MAFCASGRRSAALAAFVFLGGGCSSSKNGTDSAHHGGGPEAGIIFVRPLGDGSTGHSDPPPGTLPPGYTKTDKGGMKLGDPVAGDDPGSSGTPDGGAGGCGTTLLAVVRDFHPDGKNFEGAIADDRGPLHRR